MGYGKTWALPLTFALSLVPVSAAFGSPQQSDTSERVRDPRVKFNVLNSAQLTGADLDAARVAADQHPWGSALHPLRVEMPEGQRAYLGDLRCSDLTQPQFKRRRNVGHGVYGNIVDLYDVDCGDAAPGKVEIYMDMYFIGEGEARPVPGFTIAR